MKLFLVHCGFYNRELASGLYEAHCDYVVAAEDFEAAKKQAKLIPEFKKHKMHVDGVLLIEAADGYRVKLEKDAKLKGKTLTTRTKEGWDALND